MYRLKIVTHVYMKLWVPDNLVLFLHHSGINCSIALLFMHNIEHFSDKAYRIIYIYTYVCVYCVYMNIYMYIYIYIYIHIYTIYTNTRSIFMFRTVRCVWFKRFYANTLLFFALLGTASRLKTFYMSLHSTKWKTWKRKRISAI